MSKMCILPTLSLCIYDKTTADAEVLVGSKQRAVFIETRKSHPVWVSFQDDVIPPKHIFIHVIMNTVITS